MTTNEKIINFYDETKDLFKENIKAECGGNFDKIVNNANRIANILTMINALRVDSATEYQSTTHSVTKRLNAGIEDGSVTPKDVLVACENKWLNDCRDFDFELDLDFLRENEITQMLDSKNATSPTV